MADVAVSANAKKRKPAKRKAGSVQSPYSLPTAFAKGDVFTRASAVVMGLGNIVRGQFVKGAIFLLIEATFIFLFIKNGIASLAGLGNLGPVTEQSQEWLCDGQPLADGQLVCPDGSNPVFENLPATNSVVVLLYGVAWVFIIGFFIVLWASAVKSAYKAQVLATKNGKPPTITEDFKDLFDNRVHNTLMSLPTLGIFVFTVLPLVFMMAMAFTSFDRNHNPAFNWAGFDNFATVFSRTGSIELGVNLGLFVRVLIWTLVWAFLATFLNFFLGMFMAMIILRKGVKAKGLWRACFSMSIAVPQFVSLLAINLMLQPQGIVNQTLQSWGWIDSALPFFTDQWWARSVVIIVNLWVGIPYTIMQITGILQNVPAEIYEASKIDGANGWQTYVNVTMPYIFFVMTPYLITTFTANVNNFNVIYLLSNGAPTPVGDSAGQTDLLITWLYKLTVDRYNYNVGAVIGILTFVVLAAVALITYRRSGSYQNEEGFR
ncbi:MAG: sugar ABC transporter permease [Propionibacteriaceae bacterium]|jgi:arabinogalactan oligomer/maltooligosaccharide transport system permease protein|nr:sugar ABC transporter permease [Propionibacteriaceae bacterium]